MIETELALVNLGRAFPAAEVLLGAVPTGASLNLVVGWHDTGLSAYSGAAAVVRPDGVLAAAVGQTLLVAGPSGAAAVYVVGSAADLETDLSLARRAFLAVAPLAAGAAECSVNLA